MWLMGLRIAKRLGVPFSERFHPYKGKMSINKIFHRPVSALPAKSATDKDKMGHIGNVAYLVILKPVSEKIF